MTSGIGNLRMSHRPRAGPPNLMHISYQVMKDCVAASVKGAIIISAGFKETGEEGAKLEQEIMDIARDGNIRVVGPNCLGVMVSL